jgi:hypothetical protein
MKLKNEKKRTWHWLCSLLITLLAIWGYKAIMRARSEIAEQQEAVDQTQSICSTLKPFAEAYIEDEPWEFTVPGPVPVRRQIDCRFGDTPFATVFLDQSNTVLQISTLFQAQTLLAETSAPAKPLTQQQIIEKTKGLMKRLGLLEGLRWKVPDIEQNPRRWIVRYSSEKRNVRIEIDKETGVLITLFVMRKP